MTGDRGDTLNALIDESEALQKQLQVTTESLAAYSDRIQKAIAAIRERNDHAEE